MADVCWVSGAVVATFVVAFAMLAARDARRNRRREEERPIDERINQIGDDARLQIRQLQGGLERPNIPEDFREWGPQVIGLLQRLESLATSSNSQPEECHRLAEEASRYLREHRIKGIFVADGARRLEQLLRARNARSKLQSDVA